MVKMRQRHLCVFEFEKGSFDEILAYIQYNADFMRDRLLAFHDDITPEIREFLCGLGAMPFKIENQKILQQGKVKQLTINPSVQKQSVMQGALHNEGMQNAAIKKIKITLDSNDLAHAVINNSEEEDLNQKDLDTNSLDNVTIGNIPEDFISDSKIARYNIKSQKGDVVQKNLPNNKETMPMVTFRRTIRSGEEIILESHAAFIRDIHEGALIKSSGNLHIYGRCHGVLECFGDYIIIGEFDMGRISLQNIILEGKMLEMVRSSKKLKMLTIEHGEISLCELL